MDDLSVERASALDGHYTVGHFGLADQTGVIFEEQKDLLLHQVAAWPESLAAVGDKIAKIVGTETAPGPRRVVTGTRGAVLRIEPLKFWLIGQPAPALTAVEGATLDLSHSRTRLRLSGPHAATLLNRFLPLNFAEDAFPVGSVASTAFHHVGITLWRSEAGYDLFLPRGFSYSLWELLLEGAAQFGYEVK